MPGRSVPMAVTANDVVGTWWTLPTRSGELPDEVVLLLGDELEAEALRNGRAADVVAVAVDLHDVDGVVGEAHGQQAARGRRDQPPSLGVGHEPVADLDAPGTA